MFYSVECVNFATLCGLGSGQNSDDWPVLVNEIVKLFFNLFFKQLPEGENMSKIKGIYAVHDRGLIVVMPDAGEPICVLSDVAAEMLARQLVEAVCEARGIDFQKTVELAAKERIQIVTEG